MSEQEKGPVILKISPEEGNSAISDRKHGKAEARRTTSASFTNNIQDDDPHPDD
jgi:hypothetical protein